MDEKFWRKNREENFFGGCLVGGKGGKKIGEAHVLSYYAHQNVYFLK